MYKELIEKNIKLCQINYCGEMCECEDKLKSYSKCLLISYLEEENIRLEGENRDINPGGALDRSLDNAHSYGFNQALQSQVEHNKEVISYLKGL